jgi:hypothetical protein
MPGEVSRIVVVKDIGPRNPLSDNRPIRMAIRVFKPMDQAGSEICDENCSEDFKRDNKDFHQ